jgi:F-type H+-transporting ATPase subunit a
MSVEEHAPSSSDYIVHHLTHWQNKPQTEIVDFSVINIDSVFFSILLGGLACFFLWRAGAFSGCSRNPV